MSKNRIKILILLLIIISLPLVYFLSQKRLFRGDELEKIKINDNEFVVESANNREEQARGLGGRESLCENCGMIFNFSEKGKQGFWMKGMKFDLDIIWISGNEIVYMVKNIPYNSKEIMAPDVEADKVLEINAGKVDRLGLKLGDKIIFKN